MKKRIAKMVVASVELFLNASMEWESSDAPLMAEGLTFRTQPSMMGPSDGDPASVAVAKATEYLEGIGIDIESVEVFPPSFETVGDFEVY